MNGTADGQFDDTLWRDCFAATLEWPRNTLLLPQHVRGLLADDFGVHVWAMASDIFSGFFPIAVSSAYGLQLAFLWMHLAWVSSTATETCCTRRPATAAGYLYRKRKRRKNSGLD
jgi:hypothetical protein